MLRLVGSHSRLFCFRGKEGKRVLKFQRIQKRTCMNCSHLRRLPDLPVRDRTQTGGYVSCDMEWFWNKFRKDRRNAMKMITVEKKGGRYAKECQDFDNRHMRKYVSRAVG